MLTKVLTVCFIATLASMVAAHAEPVRQQYKSCVDTCYIEQMACQFVNDLDTCDTSATQCSQNCERRFPTIALCLNNCESFFTFCRQDGYSMQSVCSQERTTCGNRCDVPATLSQVEH